MNWRAIRAIVRKDLQIMLKNKMVVLPMIIVPLIMLVALPVLITLIASDAAAVADFTTEMNLFFDNLPAGMRAEMQSFELLSQQVVYLMSAYLFSPMFLIVPMMASSVMGADSFAGERERRTMEALLYTPLTDMELYVAKLLTALIPAVVISLLGGVIYAVVINLAAWNVMGRIFFPNVMWLAMILWLAPAAAGLGLAVMVIVSSRVKTMQEAYQTGGLVVLPVIFLLVAQFAGAVYFSLQTVLILGLIVWVVNLTLLYVGAKTFQRSELIAKL